MLGAVLGAAMSNTSTAGIGNHIPTNRAFIAGYRNNLDNIVVFLAGSIQNQRDSFIHDGSFLVDAATHARLRTRDDGFGNVQ